MTVIFNATNLTAGTSYQTPYFNADSLVSVSINPLTFGDVAVSLNILKTIPQFIPLPPLKSGKLNFRIPSIYSGSQVKLTLIPSTNLSRLTIEATEQYDYKFSGSTLQEPTGSNYEPQLTRIEDKAILIGGKVDLIPTYNSQNDINYIKTEIPKLAYGNGQQNLSDSISALGSSIANLPNQSYDSQFNSIQNAVNASRSDSSNIPRNTYNGQLDRIEAHSNGANAGIATVRSEQGTRFGSTDNQLSAITGQLTIIGNGLTTSSTVSVNSNEFIAPLIVNLPWLDLTYLLGSVDGGFTNPGGTVVNAVGNVTENNDANTLLFKTYGISYWHSTNAPESNIVIDFGFNKNARTIKLTSLGFQSWFVGHGYSTNLTIEGSNDNSTYTTIYEWNAIGFNADAQWKYATFSNNTAYRYIRISQTGLNTSGTNYFACRELRFYGSIQNP